MQFFFFFFREHISAEVGNRISNLKVILNKICLLRSRQLFISLVICSSMKRVNCSKFALDSIIHEH